MTSSNRMRNRGGGVLACRGISSSIAMLGALLAAVAVLVMTAAPATAATPTPRIDLRVLLLGTSTTEPDFQAWEAALQREGVQFDALIESSPSATGAGHTSLGLTLCTGSDPCQSLSDVLGDGTPEAKYEAVIVATGGLPICGSTCTSALSSGDWAALEQYEHKFNVRQLTGDAFPGGGGVGTDNYGLNAPTVSGLLDGVVWSVSTDGQAVFPYLNGVGKMDTGTYGYEATPISTTTFKILVSGPSSSSLVGIYTHPDGVQEMVETYNQNQYELQAQLLRHGAIAWVTRGIYFGDQRNYLATHIDDNFLSDAAWSISGNATTPAHSTDFNEADSLREVPADVVAAANWSRQNNFRIDMLFNGGGSVAVANGDTLVGAGDSGSGGTGSTGGSTGTGSGTDPLLAQFTTTNPSTGKAYTSDFSWISHTWDHPNIDEGCATQKYIEAELNQNTAWATKAASGNGDAINGGLGLTSTTDPATALGAVNPQVLVPGEHSGLANLIPGNPGQVDPPSLDTATASTGGGTLAAGQYVYAVADQFNTAAPGQTPVAAAGESAASVSSPVVVSGTGSVALSWGAVCHAGVYNVYRAPYTPGTGTAAGTIGAWSKIGTVNANTSTDFKDPTAGSTTNSAGGGAGTKTFTDTGLAGTPTGSSGTLTASTIPSTEGAAIESAYEQNPALDSAFQATSGGGIKYVGADASKPYPNPADGSFATGTPPATQYTAGQVFSDAGVTAIPRYPTNIYYNVSTNAQELDEYQTLYDLPTCKPVTGVTTCNPAGTVFTIDQIVASVDQGMFQHLMGNDPRPHYFHQTNLMSQTSGTVSGMGDGLFYETMNPLLAEYHQYFASNSPIEQLTMPQIATLLTEQANWAANTQVSGYIQGNQVTITNAGTAATYIPLTGIPAVGSAYGGLTSGWTTVPAGTSTFTSSTTWPADTVTVTLSPASIVANGTSTSAATMTMSADGNPVAGDPIVLTSSDPGEKISAITDNKNGTYTATITSSTTVHPVTITATDSAVAPVASGQATLNQSLGTAASVTVSLAPSSIVANGTSTSTATATVTDNQGHSVSGDHVGFSSSDTGEKIGAVTDRGNGSYTATITSSKAAGTATITASDTFVSPAASGQATLTQTAAPAPPATVQRPASVQPPSVRGTARVGQTLTTSPGTWSGTAPIGYAYQWQRCTSASRCANIGGARSSSYKLAAADRNMTVRVVVTASNAAGSAQAASAPVGPVAGAPAVASTAALRTMLMRLLTPQGHAGRIGALLKRGGYSAVVTLPMAGRVNVAWYVTVRTGKSKRRVIIARVVKSVTAGHNTKITIKLTKDGRRLLAGQARLQLTGSGTLLVQGVPIVSNVRVFVIRK